MPIVIQFMTCREAGSDPNSNVKLLRTRGNLPAALWEVACGSKRKSSEWAVRVAGDLATRPCDRGDGCHLKCFVYGTSPNVAQVNRECFSHAEFTS
jgi:hypothetical protein